MNTMEICRCLNDVITDVEKQNNIIIRARTTSGTLVLIDLYKLKLTLSQNEY